ncbi:MAG: FecR domain-containing protein [Spirochaetales bacterium]|nr:FecR domain-containing protein [Spirochaetales bacterium]
MKKLLLPILLILVGLPVSLMAQEEPTAVLEYFEDPYGDMIITDDTGTALDYFDFGEDLPPGFSISTGNGMAEIRLYPNGTILKLAENTDFSITNLQGYRGSPSNEFSLLAGKMRTIAARTSGSNYYNVRTPTAVMGVRGTDFINEVGQGAANVVVREGLVEVIPFSGNPVMAGANQSVNTLSEVFQATDLPPQQVNQMFRNMGFKRLSPADVPGHTPMADEEPVAEAPLEEQPAEEEVAEAQEPAPAPEVPTLDEQQMADAQETEKKEENKPSADSKLAQVLRDIIGMEIGTTTINGNTYSKVVFQPRVELGKFRLGLFLPIIYTDNMFDPAQWYQPEGNHEWSFGTDQNGIIKDVLLDILRDTMLKLKYVEYGDQGWDPFYLKIGNLDNMSIGHGAIMNGFANDAEFPAIRKVGLNTGFDLGVFGMELVGDNLADPSIVGGRLFLNPFKGYDPFQIGVTGIADLFPARGTEADPADYGDPWLLAFGMDLELFKISRDNFRILMFGDFSTMMPVFREETNLDGILIESGVSPGIWLDDGQLKNYGIVAGLRGSVFSFNWSLEYRMSSGIYKPTLFNAHYDRNKLNYLSEIINYLWMAKNDDPDTQELVMGIYGEAGFSLKDKISLSAGYYWPWEISSAGEISFAGEDVIKITLAVTDKLIPPFPIHGSISYERTQLINTFKGEGDLSLFDANTVVYGELVYPLAPVVDLVLGASTTILVDPDTGETLFEPGTTRPQVAPVINIETRIHF